MPLALIKPGRRKANRYYLIRGTVDGRRIEVSTKTTDEALARAFKTRLLREIAESRLPRSTDRVSFARAARFYIEFRNPGDDDLRRIAGAVRELGDRPVGDIGQADIVRAADNLKPMGSPATRNREVVRPVAAILHYAARNGWCGWKRVSPFREPKPRTRATSEAVAMGLIAATEGDKRLLLLWLFKQGDRISDPLKLRWEHVDLGRGTVTYVMGKTGAERHVPLDDEVVVELANVEVQQGWLFPWRTRSGVYKWLRPLTRELGIAFTPHMARHSVGKWMNDEGAGLRTIMEKLGHADPKSSLRYQAGDIEVVRAATRKLPSLSPSPSSGETAKKARKS